ncbi:ubiquitin carboxyl-terminal hydrolase 2 [Stachybotrys elegans]|uniref:Ubiquitin carboxyl-terminal hydrolase n=1 Tax=Stachybotrys elegans TaxID=80388 RepID=A0A8K0WMW9_9HYPO|nr:ubiquitin carboxyl-terminal hydrolase 2 [Stachybotrys elegans]
MTECSAAYLPYLIGQQLQSSTTLFPLPAHVEKFAAHWALFAIGDEIILKQLNSPTSLSEADTPIAVAMSGGWNTIESDAGVFTSLIENLGVKGVQFEELLTLDPSELLTLHPVYGVIFLFKYPTDRPYATPDGPLDGTFDHGAADNIFFAAQTIQNACATQALLSVLMNKTDEVDIGGPLLNFKEFSKDFPPEFRGEALSNSDLIREVHNSFARSNPFVDETQRTGEAEDAFHFIAYTPINGVLYELDGLQPAPISHGACPAGDFPAKVVEVLQRRVARYDATEIRFNLLAMCGDLRVRAREFGDEELLAREERKRRDWHFENALRKHNFVGFAGEVLKGVVGARLVEGGDAAVDRWVAEGLERRKTAEKALRRGDGDVDMGE